MQKAIEGDLAIGLVAFAPLSALRFSAPSNPGEWL
jgi:hypothetical protein